MKKLFLIVAAMFAAVSFSACSDDDDFDVANIVGTWKYVREVGYEISDGEREDYDETINSDMRYVFNEDGTGKLTEKEDGYFHDDRPFTWAASGSSQLTISFTNVSNGEQTYTILKLTSSEMQLHYHNKKLDEHGRDLEENFTKYFTR